MSLTKKQKYFINQNLHNISVKDMSTILKCPESDILSFLKKTEIISKPNSKFKDKIQEVFEYKTLKEVLLENINFFTILSIFLFALYQVSFNSILLSDEITVYQTNILTKQTTILNALHTTLFPHIVNLYIFGLNGVGYRIVTLFLHIFNMILFFYLFRNFFSEKVLKVALVLLSAHSLITESIVWVSANPYVYMATLYLISSSLSLKFKQTKNILYFLGSLKLFQLCL